MVSEKLFAGDGRRGGSGWFWISRLAQNFQLKNLKWHQPERLVAGFGSGVLQPVAIETVQPIAQTIFERRVGLFQNAAVGLGIKSDPDFIFIGDGLDELVVIGNHGVAGRFSGR